MTSRVLALALALAACKGSSSSQPPSNIVGSESVAKREPQTKRELRDVVTGVNGHVIVIKGSGAFTEYRDVLATVERNPHVVAAEAFGFTEVIGTGPNGTPTGFAIKGVDPVRVGKVLALNKNMTNGSVDALAARSQTPPMFVGVKLAKALGAEIGTGIELKPPPGGVGKAWRASFRVAGIFETGFPEYDEHLAYITLEAMQTVITGDNAIGVEAVVKDIETSEATAREIEKTLGGPPYQVMDWFELNLALFKTRQL